MSYGTPSDMFSIFVVLRKISNHHYIFACRANSIKPQRGFILRFQSIIRKAFKNEREIKTVAITIDING